ncbi:lipopolysaccharide biosynthesis protein [Chitinilyticum piscinae]|uniref:Polysaccharide biosynthesis protein n=1 Tax=Chitinilyticum piscinae TaxID=2866724 RepID=A0A8J7FKR5_9NEIS|nr:hypothetical protein [Chitinilyticum piscinae]MBE9609552.1 hypothetical protein [Chitinilyticum piscinae]
MAAGLHQAALESIAARLLYLLTRLALPPLVLAHVGLAEYGLWSIAFVLVGYLGLSVSGLATVYVREIARAYEQDDASHASRILSTGVLLALVLGGAFCTLLALLLPWVLAQFHLVPALHALATQLIMATCLIFLADLTLGAWGYVLHGLKRVHEQQRIWVTSFLLEWLAVAVLLQLDLGMSALLWAFALRYACSITLARWRVHLAWPALQIRLRLVSLQCLPQFARLGLASQLSDGWAMLLHSGDRLLAGAAFGAAATAILDLGSKLPATAISLSSGINQVLLPHAATARESAVSAIYHSGLRLGLLALLPVMPMLVAVAPALLTAWLGPRAELALLVSICLWMTPAWHLHTLTGAASSTLRGQGQIRLEFVYHGLRSTGLLAAALLAGNLASFVEGVALSLGVSALIYLWLASRTLGMSGTMLLCTLRPLLLIYPAAYAMALLCPWQLASRSSALQDLLLYGAIAAASLLLGIWKTALLPAEKALLQQTLRRLGAKETRHA